MTGSRDDEVIVFEQELALASTPAIVRISQY
jgi:hypothetical protein